MDTEFDGLLPGSTATVLRASSVSTIAEPTKPSPRPPNAPSKPVAEQLQAGPFATVFQQYLKSDASAKPTMAEEDEEEDMVRQTLYFL